MVKYRLYLTAKKQIVPINSMSDTVNPRRWIGSIEFPSEQAAYEYMLQHMDALKKIKSLSVLTLDGMAKMASMIIERGAE